MTYDPIEGIRRRREAARRLPPLADGRRDPNGPITDAPDQGYLEQLQTLREAWTAVGRCEEHAPGLRAQIERHAAQLKGAHHA